MPSNGGSERRPYIRSVERAFRVILAFDAERPRLTLSEVARITDLDRATARRLLLTLADLGYVRVNQRDFELSPRLLELGYSYLSSMSLVDVVQPHLQRLARDLNETASLTVLDGDDVVYVGLAVGGRLSAVNITVGTRFKAHATSMGRVLLAGLSDDELEDHLARVQLETWTEYSLGSIAELRMALKEAREQGWALVDQELELGLRGVAAPVRDRTGAVVAAINVSVHTGRASASELTQSYLPRLRDAAESVEADLRGKPLVW